MFIGFALGMTGKLKTLGLATAMLLPHGTLAMNKIGQAINIQIIKTLKANPNEEKRSDTFYVGSQEKPHQEIIQMQFNDIIAIYGKEKGMEIIRNHFIEEINTMRKNQGLNVLDENNMLDSATQKHVSYLYNHANEYDFTGNDKTKKSPHMEYDSKGAIANGPGKRATKAGYFFSLISENISAIGALKPSNPGTIASVLQEWINEKGHKKNIFSLTRDIGVGYYNGIVVIVFAK